ncbi:MAG: hypothetical protein ABSC95_12365 [Acetobacteraceae bacterium]|jgi:hypothetical protein
MRLIIWLALPVGLLIGAAGVTIVYEMANGMGHCATWLSIVMPYCW